MINSLTDAEKSLYLGYLRLTIKKKRVGELSAAEEEEINSIRARFSKNHDEIIKIAEDIALEQYPQK